MSSMYDIFCDYYESWITKIIILGVVSNVTDWQCSYNFIQNEVHQPKRTSRRPSPLIPLSLITLFSVCLSLTLFIAGTKNVEHAY